MHHRRTPRLGGDPSQRGRQTAVAAAVEHQSGGGRHRTSENGTGPPRRQADSCGGARRLRLRARRLLALAGIHHRQRPHGRRLGADSRTVRIPGARRALEAAQHDQDRQERPEPRARNRRIRADDVHAQPPEQPGCHRGARAFRAADVRYNNPAQHPFGRGPLARQARHVVRRAASGSVNYLNLAKELLKRNRKNGN